MIRHILPWYSRRVQIFSIMRSIRVGCAISFPTVDGVEFWSWCMFVLLASYWWLAEQNDNVVVGSGSFATSSCLDTFTFLSPKSRQVCWSGLFPVSHHPCSTPRLANSFLICLPAHSSCPLAARMGIGNLVPISTPDPQCTPTERKLTKKAPYDSKINPNINNSI